MQIKYKKLIAVTLVELLAVLSIMGVVAALTLPALKKHSQKTEYAKLVQHTYSTLESAFDTAVYANDSDPDDWGVSDSEQIMEAYLKPHINIVEKCDSKDGGTFCFPTFHKFDGSGVRNVGGSSYQLASGAQIGVDGTNNYFFIDANGSTPPNREGADIFVFELGKFNANCVDDSENGRWKFCPTDDENYPHAKELVQDSWNITYW